MIPSTLCKNRVTLTYFYSLGEMWMETLDSIVRMYSLCILWMRSQDILCQWCSTASFVFFQWLHITSNVNAFDVFVLVPSYWILLVWFMMRSANLVWHISCWCDGELSISLYKHTFHVGQYSWCFCECPFDTYHIDLLISSFSLTDCSETTPSQFPL